MPTWVYVRDLATGHQYDVDERRLPRLAGKVEIVEGVEPRSGPTAQPRRTKHFRGKDGQPAVPRRSTSTAADEAVKTTKE